MSRTNRHHLTPRSRNDQPFHGNHQQNILHIDVEKHEKWHALWGTRTLEEVLALLSRLARAKRRQ
jgi:hypothetical protein